MKRYVYEFATDEVRKINATPTTAENIDWKLESLLRINKAVEMCKRSLITEYEAVCSIGNFERKAG